MPQPSYVHGASGIPLIGEIMDVRRWGPVIFYKAISTPARLIRLRKGASDARSPGAHDITPASLNCNAMA